jgi:hypothetical protein
MPNELHSLVVDEISLVDHPCCAEIDPRTGRKIKRATIALKKRDSDDESPVKQSTNKEYTRMQDFEAVIKSARTRDELCAAVRVEAEARVAKKGGSESLSEAEARVWRKHPEAVAKYEALPLPVFKRERPMIRITKAEALLDQKARQVMRRNPTTSYPQACSEVLLKEPGLYSQYCNEMAAGQLFDVPDPVSKSDGGDSECENCGGSGMVGNKTCPACDGDGVAEPDADDTEEAKKRLLRKLDSMDDLERRILRVEAAVKKRF